MDSPELKRLGSMHAAVFNRSLDDLMLSLCGMWASQRGVGRTVSLSIVMDTIIMPVGS
jgi:hypothetical protein